MSHDVADKVFELTRGVVKEEGCELVDVEVLSENGQRVLRLYIDNPTGPVQLIDCSRVSHAVEDLLEIEGVLQGRYNLEISSPGINRPLRLPEHFEKVVAQNIKVVTKDKIAGRKNFKGILRAIDAGVLTLEIDNQNFKVPLDAVAKARLVMETDKE